MKLRGMKWKTSLVIAFLCLFAFNISEAAPTTKRVRTTKSKVVNKNSKTMKRNTFQTPDFAYPQTVEKNAQAAYDAALKTGDGQNALLAAIQLNVAAASVDAAGSRNESAKRYHDLSMTLKAPWNSMASLLEAVLYQDVYQEDSWLYDNRILPLDNYPEDMSAWSRDMFAAKVIDAVNMAAAQAQDVNDTPLSEVKGLLRNYEVAVETGMTIPDFVDLKGAELLSTFAGNSDVPLQFGKNTASITVSDKCRDLRDNVLQAGMKRNRAIGNVPVGSLFSTQILNYINYEPRRVAWNEECYKLYGQSEWGANFVSNYVRDKYLTVRDPEHYRDITNSDRRTALEILKAYNSKFPSPRVPNESVSQIAQLTRPEVMLEYPTQVIIGDDWKCRVSMSNLYDFNILIYKVSSGVVDGNAIEQSKLLANGRIVRTIPVKATGTTPDELKDSVTVGSLQPGSYVLLASETADASGLIDKSKYNSWRVMTVSDLSYFISESRTDGARLYVVSAHNQKPVQGAKVTCSERTYRGNAARKELVTDKDGSIKIPFKSCQFTISYNGNQIKGSNYYYSGSGSAESEDMIGTVLTDLSIYKPGDKVQFVGVTGLRKNKHLSELGGKEIQYKLRDANWQVVDSLSVVTDNYGRANGSFTLPATGLLGNYRVVMMHGARQIASADFEVADYKSPTFKVLTDKINDNYQLGDTLRISGKAVTYSGMPVSGSKVSYTVNYSPWRWWWGMSQRTASFTGSAVTGHDGEFTIELPTETVKDTPYEKGVFTLEVTVTDAAGESNRAPKMNFSLMSAYSINANIPGKILVGSDKYGEVSVSDMSGHPVEKEIYYTVADKAGKTVLSGSCKSGAFKPDFSSLPSGSYKLNFSMTADMKATAECENTEVTTILWRESDKVPPIETALWTPVTEITMQPGQKDVTVKVGSSYKDSYIFALIDDGSSEVRREWIEVSDGFAKMRLDAPATDKRLFVSLTGMHDLDSETSRIDVIPAQQEEKVEIVTESFRDKLEPGAKEQWKFKFLCGGKPMASRPVMAVMTNAALNAINPFAWQLNPYGILAWGPISSIDVRNSGTDRNYFSRHLTIKDRSGKFLVVPQIYTYGKALDGAIYQNEVLYMAAPTSARIYGSSTRSVKEMKLKSVKNEAADYDMALEEAEVTADSATGADGGAQNKEDQEELRPVDCPLAFFMPDLTTDAEGIATVGFNVPQFNGTWQFQIAGYTPDLRGGVKILDAVAAKKVMVQMNAPRFLRTGDKATVSATLFNNSGEDLPLTGTIRILDADGKVLKEQDYAAETLPASGQRTVTIEYTVPSDLSVIRIEAYARGGNHRDGEGTTVEVLPSSTPVLESKPFYAGPGKRTINVDMPVNAKNATVTLQYCGNPIWECVTALPEILKPESSNILSQISALYGNAIAKGLIGKYPQLGEAIRTFAAPENAGDSTLVSNLEKNAAIKVVALNSTPWVNDAADETRRMQSLIKYCNTADAQAAIDAIMKVLKDRQNNDGGWSWCPDMPTSEFITARVLLHFAMLKGMGYLPEGAEEMAVKAFDYVDRSMAKDWEKSKRKYFSTTELLNYLYVKSFFPEVGNASTFLPLRGKALTAIANGWREFSIYDKATAVTLEYRLNNKALASNILESLRQFATVTPEKGMCFENLKGTFSGWNPLITTAQVLEAYGEAAPEDTAVDQLRQWLLMSKQTQNWGEMRGTAEVVQALLSTGSDWTVASENARVYVGDKEIAVPGRAKLTDSFTITLTKEQTRKGDVRIEKTSAGPAWGGIVSQYVAPILSVKSRGIPQLKIEKNVYSIENGKAIADNLKVGDKVRVTLTITTDRDMDYVAVMDSRSACLEPADQLSGYRSSDGVWMYREVRNESTNLFIPFLPKGTTVVNYECYVDRAGEYTLGIAGAQSQYTPVISAHSAGVKLTVNE